MKFLIAGRWFIQTSSYISLSLSKCIYIFNDITILYYFSWFLAWSSDQLFVWVLLCGTASTARCSAAFFLHTEKRPTAAKDHAPPHVAAIHFAKQLPAGNLPRMWANLGGWNWNMLVQLLNWHLKKYGGCRIIGIKHKALKFTLKSMCFGACFRILFRFPLLSSQTSKKLDNSFCGMLLKMFLVHCPLLGSLICNSRHLRILRCGVQVIKILLQASPHMLVASGTLPAPYIQVAVDEWRKFTPTCLSIKTRWLIWVTSKNIRVGHLP